MSLSLPAGGGFGRAGRGWFGTEADLFSGAEDTDAGQRGGATVTEVVENLVDEAVDAVGGFGLRDVPGAGEARGEVGSFHGNHRLGDGGAGWPGGAGGGGG